MVIKDFLQDGHEVTEIRISRSLSRPTIEKEFQCRVRLLPDFAQFVCWVSDVVIVGDAARQVDDRDDSQQ